MAKPGAMRTAAKIGTDSTTIRTCIIRRTSGDPSTTVVARVCISGIRRRCAFRSTIESGRTTIQIAAATTTDTTSTWTYFERFGRRAVRHPARCRRFVLVTPIVEDLPHDGGATRSASLLGGSFHCAASAKPARKWYRISTALSSCATSTHSSAVWAWRAEPGPNTTVGMPILANIGASVA